MSKRNQTASCAEPNGKNCDQKGRNVRFHGITFCWFICDCEFRFKWFQIQLFLVLCRTSCRSKDYIGIEHWHLRIFGHIWSYLWCETSRSIWTLCKHLPTLGFTSWLSRMPEMNIEAIGESEVHIFHRVHKDTFDIICVGGFKLSSKKTGIINPYQFETYISWQTVSRPHLSGGSPRTFQAPQLWIPANTRWNLWAISPSIFWTEGECFYMTQKHIFLKRHGMWLFINMFANM